MKTTVNRMSSNPGVARGLSASIMAGIVASSLLLTGTPATAAQSPAPDDKEPTSLIADMPPAAPPGISDAMDEVRASAEKHGIALNKVWYEADKNTVMAIVPPSPVSDTKGFQADISTLSLAAKGFTVAIRNARRSLDEATSIQSRVDEDTTLLAEMGIPITASGITTDGDSVMVDVVGAKDVTAIRSQLVARYGEGIDVKAVADWATPTASRQSDYSPWFGGDIYNAAGSSCTSGFAVYKPGFGHYMLTAGHCFSGTGITANYAFTPPIGSSYFGYSSQQEYLNGQPSDAALVTGSYSPYVWNGGANGSSFLPVKYSNDAIGEPTNEVCFDGGFTGQVCRGMINRENLTLTYQDGHQTTGLVEAIHYDPGYMCQLGDSGSPVYDGYLAGGVRARGILVSKFSVGPQANVCMYLPWNTIATRFGSSQGRLQVDVP